MLSRFTSFARYGKHCIRGMGLSTIELIDELRIVHSEA